MLETYRLQLVRPACEPQATTLGALVEFDEDISAVFPYLNATVKGARYSPGGPFLRLRLGSHSVSLHSDHLAMARFVDEAEARQTMDEVVRLLNETWARRGEIEPSYEKAGSVTALEIFRRLPRTNCGKCGQPTCLAFAGKVAADEAELEGCPEMAG